MRIVAFSDIHGFHAVYARIPRIAVNKKADCVVLAGDLLGIPDGFDSIEAAQRADAKKIVRILSDLEVPVFYVMGNDDWVDLDPNSAVFHGVHATRHDEGSLNFVGYQFTLPFMGGINERPESVMEQDLARLEKLMNESTVLVTHGPAHGILDFGILDRHVGSPSLRAIIERTQTRIHIHGHIHGSFGRSGRHFNVASGGKIRGMLIDSDSMEHEIINERGH